MPGIDIANYPNYLKWFFESDIEEVCSYSKILQNPYPFVHRPHFINRKYAENARYFIY